MSGEATTSTAGGVLCTRPSMPVYGCSIPRTSMDRRAAEREIRACEERGIAFLSWGPFGGMRQAKSLGAGGSPFAEVAGARRVSIHQIALAWQPHRSPIVIPIPGASRPESVLDSVAAASLTLTAEELALLDAPAETGS